ncbi:MAG: sodium-dependent bicarbonate transport family permease [Phycisphaerales bacterium]|nr:sodium-dependent bicarbonate transport family permease [Phycisphaerales bacterium]
MDWSLITENLFAAPILFFAMGVVAGVLRSDLAIPEAVVKLMSLYLMWAIGIKGGVKLRETGFTTEAVMSLALAMVLAVIVPVYVYALLRRRLDVDNAAALSGVYGSVSAVTFLTATAFLQRRGIEFGGHMVAALALMESPAILLAVALSRRSGGGRRREARVAAGVPPAAAPAPSLASSLREAALNGPVVLLTGCMAIGAITGAAGHAMLKPLYVDLFPGVLTFFLLELGLVAARRGRVLKVVGAPLLIFAVVVPLLNAVFGLALARAAGLTEGNAFLLVVLAASASYIAAPAAIRHAIPRASPGLYLPLALAVTFPFNITLGLPLYWALVDWLWK